MPRHAGFAGALTVRETVFRIALKAAYANGNFLKKFSANVPGGPPDINADLFLGQPTISCEGLTNLLVLNLTTWGTLKVTVDNVDHDVEIVGELEVTIKPVFDKDGVDIVLVPNVDDISARRWTASVTSANTPTEIVSYITGDQFRERLQSAIQTAISLGIVKLPAIDGSFLGDLVRFATSIDVRVRGDALLLGINAENEDQTTVLNGNIAALQDFAGTHNLAGVVHKDASKFMFDKLYVALNDGIENNDAKLEGFRMRSLAGHYQVSGAAVRPEGSIDFSFQVVPYLYHTRPGKFFQYSGRHQPVRVNTRTWPVLDFKIEHLQTDIERNTLIVIFGEIIGGLITGGFLFSYIETKFIRAESAFSAKVKAAKLGSPQPRVIRTIPPEGGVAVRYAVDQYEVNIEETYIGISVQSTPGAMVLVGPTVVPANYSNETLRYLLRLPSGVFEDDPAMRVRWTIEDRTNNLVLADEDSSLAHHMRMHLALASYPDVTDFGITARLYRRMGTIVNELGIVSLTLHMRGTLPSNAYIRWRSESSNPQLEVGEQTDEWGYLGDRRVRRWSEWHRTDAPCLSVNVENRYRFEIETADKLPFELRLLENHRKGLCPYCFFGGPAAVNARL
jgi:hypothetical protein